MTAAGLLELLNLHGCEPAAVAGDFGPELEYAAPAPPGAEAFVPLLRTGVVSILARRRWYGLAADGHAFELSPRAAIPPAAMYLAAERRAGDPEAGCWDAVQPRHRRELAACFARPPETAKRRDTGSRV